MRAGGVGAGADDAPQRPGSGRHGRRPARRGDGGPGRPALEGPAPLLQRGRRDGVGERAERGGHGPLHARLHLQALAEAGGGAIALLGRRRQRPRGRPGLARPLLGHRSLGVGVGRRAVGPRRALGPASGARGRDLLAALRAGQQRRIRRLGQQLQLGGRGAGLLGAPLGIVLLARGRRQRPRGGRGLVLAEPAFRAGLPVSRLGLRGGGVGGRERGLGALRGLPGGRRGGDDRPQALRRRPPPLGPLARLAVGHRQALRGELGPAGQALRRAPQAGGQRFRRREGLGRARAIARDRRARRARLGEGTGIRRRGLAEPLGVGAGALERLRGGPRPRGAHRAAGGLHLALQRRGPLGGPRLALQRPRAAAQLPRDVARPLEPVGHAAQLELGAVPPALGHRDARGRVHDRPALGRCAGAEGLDLPLADDRQRVGPDAPGRERLLHVEQAAGGAVQPVVGVPGAGQPSCRLDLRRRRSVDLLAGEDQLDLGHRGGRPARAARVEDVRHPPGPQAARALLAERPRHGLGEVALPGAVGPHDDVHARSQLQRGLIGERLESAQREAAQHSAPDPLSRARASAAATCSEACLEVPLPRPSSCPSTSARLVKVRRSGGPSCPVSS